MSFNSIEDIYKVYGWTMGSRIDYLIKRKSNGETKEEIYEDVVENKKLCVFKISNLIINLSDPIFKIHNFI